MRLQLVRRDFQPGFLGTDAIEHDGSGIHLAELHHDEIHQPDARSGNQRLQPQAEELPDHEQNDDEEYAGDNGQADPDGTHEEHLSIRKVKAYTGKAQTHKSKDVQPGVVPLAHMALVVSALMRLRNAL